jgi:polysaccharide biosynthesis transport protein
MNYSDELGHYLNLARRRMGYFLIPLITVAAVGGATVMSLPAIYSSSAKILVESQQIPDAFVKSTVTALATERLQVIQQRVLTRENLLRIADKFNLFKDRAYLSRSDLVDVMQRRTTFQVLDLGPANRRPRKDENLTVVFSVGFDHENPDIAAKVANELVTGVLNEDVQSRNASAVETTNFLQRESERIAGELKEVDAKIASFKLENSTALPEKLTFNMGLLEKQQRAISDIDRDLRAAEQNKRLLELEATMRSSQAIGAAGSGGAQTIEQQLQALRNEYAQRSAVYSDSHPEMKALKKLIAAKERAAAKEQAELASAAPSKANAAASQSPEERLVAQKIEAIEGSSQLLTRQRAELITSNDKLQDIVLRTPKIGAELSALERRRDALQSGNDEMAAKLSQARLGERLEQNQQAERFEVIETPIVPQAPSRPKRLPLMFLVAALSLGSGFGAAAGAEFFDGTIKRSSDLTEKLGHKVLAVVPYIATKKELQNRQRRTKMWSVVLAAGAILSLLAVHLLYLPLDAIAGRIFNAIRSIFI